MPRNTRRNQKNHNPILEDFPAHPQLKNHNIDGILPLILDILANVGLRINYKPIIDKATNHGANYDGSRLFISKHIVNNLWDKLNNNLPFGLENTHRHYFIGGKASLIADISSKKYHNAQITDLVQCVKIADKMPLLQVICQNIALNQEPDAILTKLLPATNKPLLIALNQNYSGAKFFEMAKHHANCGLYMQNILSPLSIDSDIIAQFYHAILLGIPVFSENQPILGATAPVNFYAASALALSEALIMRILAYFINPEAPILTGITPCVMDMKIGSMTMGAVEVGIFANICNQASIAFNFPIYISCGGTDAKLPEIQAGLEKTQNLHQCNGANLINFWAGSLANGQVFSPETLYLDYEIIANHKRILLPNAPILSENLAEITDVITRKTHFMANIATKNAMNNFNYPQLLDRNSLSEFMKMNGETAINYAWHKIHSVN